MYWWNDTDRGKQNIKYWWNGTDRGKRNIEYWWNGTERGNRIWSNDGIILTG